jgi:hypothetical protein
MAEQVRDFLAAVHCYVELEVCEKWTEQECTVAAFWALEYAKNPDAAPARPHWLPLPQPPQASDEGEGTVEHPATDDSDPELDDDQTPDQETEEHEDDETAGA